MPDDALLLKQRKLEEDMRGLGATRYRNRTLAAREGGREAVTAHGLRLIRQVLDPLLTAYDEWAADTEKKCDRLPVGAAVIALGLDPRVVCFLTLRTVLNHLATPTRLQHLAIKIGRAIEDERDYAELEAANPGRFKTVLKGAPRRAEAIFKKRMARDGTQRVGWTMHTRAAVGLKLLGLVIEATGIIRTQRVSIPGTSCRTASMVVATERVQEYLVHAVDQGALMSPELLPMVAPPRDWTSPVGGGYHHIHRCPLVKLGYDGYHEELTVSDLTLVYAAVNALQRTPWKVNRQVFDVAKHLWEHKLPVAGLPHHEAEPRIGPCESADPKEIRRHAQRKRRAHELHQQAVCRRVQTAKTLWVANRFLDEDRIYFPHQLDFRGRVYPLPSHMTPQSGDLGRSLLTFADARPLGERGLHWLAVHGANCYGVDKVDFDARVAWVREHASEIAECASSPLTADFWHHASDPFQFLAFCFDWHAAAGDPEYESCLPIGMDGSCNGLQHFSAMLRDPVGGKAVNLVPSDTPQDIYGEVAKRVVDKLRARPATDTLAARWLEWGVTRKIAKRPVMILPYGGSRQAVRNYVIEAVEDEIQAGRACPWVEDIWQSACYLTPLIWDAMGETVVAARDAMKWLRDLSKCITDAGLPIVWTAPSGLPVLQAYRATKQRIITTKMGHKLVQLRLAEDTHRLDSRRQRNGISPNFVHSLDASALVFTIDACTNVGGLRHFGAVHDSYMCHAGDADLVAYCLRLSFRTMYEQSDVLADLLRDVLPLVKDPTKIPALPHKGTLNIAEVQDSLYFFA